MTWNVKCLTLNGFKNTTSCSSVSAWSVILAWELSLLLLWDTNNDKSEQHSRVLRLHSTAAAFFTRNWSRGHTRCHQLKRSCTELLSVLTNIKTLKTHRDGNSCSFGAAAKKCAPCSVPYMYPPRGAPACWSTRPAACSVALPNPDPVAGSAQMLWRRPKGGLAGRQCGSIIT